MILVLGATGGIGGEVCQLLKEAGHSFRAMCRKQEQVAGLRANGIEAVLGDLDRPETLESAMRGCEVLFLLTAPTQNQMAQEKAAIDAAKRRASAGSSRSRLQTAMSAHRFRGRRPTRTSIIICAHRASVDHPDADGLHAEFSLVEGSNLEGLSADFGRKGLRVLGRYARLGSSRRRRPD